MPAEPTRVLVLAAHPDDEVLGVGGTVALHTTCGDSVTTVIACEGESLRYEGHGVDLPRHSQRAAETLGVSDLRLLNLPDQQLDRMSLCDVIRPIEEIMRDVRPEVVYCQYGGDLNMDHKLLFEAALVATRPTEGEIASVFAFETPSSTEWAHPRTFCPDTWVDISSTLEQKLKAMSCYETELRPYPHPRSLDALRNRALSRGNECCLEAAEVFMTIRRVTRAAQPPRR
jgi:LmbE family N-acetylglucosaminyl deacetylase